MWIKVMISGRTVNNLQYVDDTVLTAQLPLAVEILLDTVDAVSRKYGLEITTKKTKL